MMMANIRDRRASQFWGSGNDSLPAVGTCRVLSDRTNLLMLGVSGASLENQNIPTNGISLCALHLHPSSSTRTFAKMESSRPVLNADGGDIPVEGSVTQIIPDGDVMLVVGPSQHKIQVSSHFLKLISPVFRAMLSAPMKEGEALENKSDHDGPIEIILPEDKEQPMDQVLRTIYSSDPGATKLSMSEAKEIAILADKYGMVERLQVFASFWLLNAAKTDNVDVITENEWNTLVVAYILKVDWAFFDVTKNMRPKTTSVIKFINHFHDKHTGLRLGSKSRTITRHWHILTILI
ncbi:hypothetical protein LB504_001852 [Fusarium proliferatum]|nr:hypothetical protein LB504_001852 [Fusarium proliferatum]